MSTRAADAADPLGREDASGAGRPRTLPHDVTGWVWWGVGAGILLLSLGIVLWARTRPGFDPYGWLVWGRQTLKLALDTNAAPSWKPLPYLFTVPYALARHYQVYLWMTTAVAVSLSGLVFAGRIAYRLVAGDGAAAADARARRAAWVAAGVAAVGLLLIDRYPHYIFTAQSDPMIVALCVGAIDMQLSRHYRWAFAMWWLASLGRPEVWPFLALYALWAWRTVPSMRRIIIGGGILLLALWFGIPGITSRSPFVAGTNAIGSGRAPHDKVTGTLDRFTALEPVTVSILALLAVAWAVWRRHRTVLLLAGGVVLWVTVEVAFALHGWPALPRYMFEAAAAVAVLAGIAIGLLLREPVRWGAAAAWAGIAVAVVGCALLLPSIVSHVRATRVDLREQRARTKLINRLRPTLNAAGGAALIRSCGEPLTRLEFQTVVAWTLGVNVARVGWKYAPAIRSSRPIVLISPGRRGGWRLRALHQRPGPCRRLPTS